MALTIRFGNVLLERFQLTDQTLNTEQSDTGPTVGRRLLRSKPTVRIAALTSGTGRFPASALLFQRSTFATCDWKYCRPFRERTARLLTMCERTRAAGAIVVRWRQSENSRSYPVS
jgi:hypothetical protein